MRIRVIHTPTENDIDGIYLDRFEVGHEYEVGPILGAYFLAQEWAEPVASETRIEFYPMRRWKERPDRAADACRKRRARKRSRR